MNSALCLRRLLSLALIAAIGLAHAGEGGSPLKNPFTPNKALAEEGGSLMNQYCAHCHGQWAEQGERPRDLRRLKLRYDNEAVNAYWETVTKGRMDKGMPIWKGVLPDETLWKIYTFLETVQSEE